MQNKKRSSDVLAKCTVCSSSFDQGNLTVLEEKDKKTTFHITCEKCHTSSIVFLSLSQGGVAGVGIATDLDDREAIRMFGGEAISADEVIDMHQLMANYKGSIADLVRKIN